MSPSTRGTALAGVCALGGTWLLVRWAERGGVSFCTSACPEPDSGLVVGLLFWSGIATMLLGLMWSPRLARASSPWLRSGLAVAAALAAGGVCLAIPFPGANAKLFLVMCASIAVLVPPLRVTWYAGAITGATIAGALHNTAWLGFGLGFVVLVTAIEALPDKARVAHTERASYQGPQQ